MKDKQHKANALLVEECKKGNREAMSRLYIQYAPRMLSLIRRYVDDMNDAQDILHDGFIIAFTRLDSLRNSERLEFWLATIMRNLALRFLKSHDVAQILHDLPEVEDQKMVEDILDLDVLLSMIASLPAGYQNVFRLAVLENKSHKEISKILGIAPNSSSSQLFRAKLQLRQLISRYQSRTGLLISLLVLMVPCIIYLIKNKPVEEKLGLHTPFPIKPTISTSVTSNINKLWSKNSHIAGKHIGNNNKNWFVTSPIVTADSCYTHVQNLRDSLSDETHNEIRDDIYFKDSLLNLADDSLDICKDSLKYQEYDDLLFADLNYPLPVPASSPENQWTASLSFNTGMNTKNLFAGDSSLPSNSGNQGGDNWTGDGNGDITWDPNNPGSDPDDPDGGKDDNKKDTSRAGRGESRPMSTLKNQSHRNHLPIAFALTAQKNLNWWLGIETGLTYTYLHTTFEELGFVTDCHWHYLGIPLKINLTAYKASRLRIYSSFGGTFYYPFYSSANEKWLMPSLKSGKFHSNPVWSLGAGVGISFSLSKRIDLYFEPTIQYYFPNNDDVPNLWSDESWGVTFPIGIRFKW